MGANKQGNSKTVDPWARHRPQGILMDGHEEDGQGECGQGEDRAEVTSLNMTEEFEDELVARVAERMAEVQRSHSDSPMRGTGTGNGTPMAEDTATLDTVLEQELARMNAGKTSYFIAVTHPCTGHDFHIW